MVSLINISIMLLLGFPKNNTFQHFSYWEAEVGVCLYRHAYENCVELIFVYIAGSGTQTGGNADTEVSVQTIQLFSF